MPVVTIHSAWQKVLLLAVLHQWRGLLVLVLYMQLRRIKLQKMADLEKTACLQKVSLMLLSLDTVVVFIQFLKELGNMLWKIQEGVSHPRFTISHR